MKEVINFAAHKIRAAPSDQEFCVQSSESNGDVIHTGGTCTGHVRLTFFLPQALPPSSSPETELRSPDLYRRHQVCSITKPNGKSVIRLDAGCSLVPPPQVTFQVPSLFDVLSSTPQDKGAHPWYMLVEEEHPCFGFICKNIWSNFM